MPSFQFSKPPVLQYPIARNRRSTETVKSSGVVEPLRVELSQRKDRSDAEIIQQITPSPRSFSETVAKDFVIPVAWSLLFGMGYILTAMKRKATQCESVDYAQTVICLICLQIHEYQRGDGCQIRVVFLWLEASS